MRDHLEGVEKYGGSLVDLEPEKPYITGFEYADFPGYAVIHVSDAGVASDVYVGTFDKVWKSVRLTVKEPTPLAR